MTALVLLAALAVVASQRFLRSYWFHRSRFTKRDADMLVPVDGRVVYIKPVTDGLVRTTKKGTYIAENWVGKQDGHLVGIYMGLYDRHFIANPIESRLKVRHERTDANLPMLDLWEYVNFYFVGRFVDWFEEKAFRYKLHNEKVIYEYEGGVKLMAIADKFVNKIEIPQYVENGHTIEQGDKIGFIRRGSQVDVFIPEALFDAWCVRVNEKVKVGNQLCTLKEAHRNRPSSASCSRNPAATPD